MWRSRNSPVYRASGTASEPHEPQGIGPRSALTGGAHARCIRRWRGSRQVRLAHVTPRLHSLPSPSHLRLATPPSFRLALSLFVGVIAAPAPSGATVGTSRDTVGVAAPAPVVLAAGDIARCDRAFDEATALLLDRRPGTVLMLGDAAYPEGAPADFARCYAPTWGRHRARTHAVPGNHDYRTRGAAGFFDYFGGDGPRIGYYSFELGAWHVVALDSNQPLGLGSRQHAWLAADLARSRARCSLAFFHHPRFSSGEHGDQPRVQSAWALLYRYGADLVLSAHDHDYERFAPQTPAGQRDDALGIRQFVVGTGGAPLRPFRAAKPHSELRDASHHGVLALTLHDDGYEWEFVGAMDDRVLDKGMGRCH